MKKTGKTKRGIDIQSLVLDNKLIMNQDKIAGSFNKYFISIVDSVISDNNKYTSTNTANSITYLSDVFSGPFAKTNWQYTITHEVDNFIRSLKTNNYIGYDEISCRIIKSSAPFIISPLTHICNAILGTGIFPDRL
jgi:hypothetical protein